MSITITLHTSIVLSLLILFSSCGDNSTDTNTVPEITSITPLMGPSGAIVTINGSGFSATASENSVRFNGVSAVINTATSDKI